ncbi:PAP-associated domain-containing protein [Plasmodiophora brassicae]
MTPANIASAVQVATVFDTVLMAIDQVVHVLALYETSAPLLLCKAMASTKNVTEFMESTVERAVAVRDGNFADMPGFWNSTSVSSDEIVAAAEQVREKADNDRQMFIVFRERNVLLAHAYIEYMRHCDLVANVIDYQVHVIDKANQERATEAYEKVAFAVLLVDGLRMVVKDRHAAMQAATATLDRSLVRLQQSSLTVDSCT